MTRFLKSPKHIPSEIHELTVPFIVWRGWRPPWARICNVKSLTCEKTETRPTFTRTRGAHMIACSMKSLRKFPHFRWTIGSSKYCQYYLFRFLQVTSLSPMFHDESRGRVLSRLSRYEGWELHWARLPTLGTSDQLLGCSLSLLLPGPVSVMGWSGVTRDNM